VRAGRLLASLCALAAMSACGTTAGVGGVSLSSPGAGDGLSGPAAVAPTTAPGAGALPGTPGSPPSVVRAPVVGAPGTGGAHQNAPGTLPPGPTDRTPVVVGAVVVNNSSLAVLGGSSEQSTGDERGTYEALFAAANAAGGLSGHPIKGVYYDLSSTSAKSQDQADQEMCSLFTQDHKAVAVLTSENTTGAGIRACLTRAGIPFVKNYLADAGEATMRANPGFAVPDSLNLDRIAAVVPPALQRNGWFGTKPVIGVVTEDSPDFAHATDQVLVPALQRLGYQVKSVARFPNVSDETGLQEGSAQAGNAIVRFRGDGVDHVVFLSRNGINLTLFANAAESQAYRPRYALSSQDAAQALVTSGLIQNPSAQLAGALTVGWIPALDVPFDRSSPYLRTPQAKSCLSRVAKRMPVPSDTQGLFHLILNCDAVDVLVRAFAGRSLGVPSFVAGVESLGTSFLPVATFGARFGPGRHDGASFTRVAAYADGRFTYRGSTSAA